MHHPRSALPTFAKATSIMALALSPLIAADAAEACGGFFCSSGPVDQQQETILFEVHESGEVSATVEVSFNGDPGAFSWVIPVPEAPTVDVVPNLTLDILDVISVPTIIPPNYDFSNCEDAFNPASACSDVDYAAPQSADAGSSDPEGARNDGVVVTEIPRVGPYDEIVFVETTTGDAGAMVQWLNDNGYIITPQMEPIVAEYVTEGWGFLATKLAPDAGVQDIAPIRFTCPNASPRLPLRLTAVAAQPDMKIAVHIMGAERFASMNYRSINIDRNDIRFDINRFESNYADIVSWEIDRAGGAAFVTESAGDTNGLGSTLNSISASNQDEQDAQNYLNALFQTHGYHTRFFSRLSASDMGDDPVFMASGGDDVDRVIDMSNRPVIQACGDDGRYIQPDDTRAPCGFGYCGPNARCATDDDGNEGCACPSGFAARQVLRARPFANSIPVIACQATSEDMLGEAVEQVGDPCIGYNCGEGASCVAINGFPTCACPAGSAAFVDVTVPAGVKCRTSLQEYDPAQLHPEQPVGGFATTSNIVGARGCSSTKNVPGALELAGILGCAWMLVRRRRSACV